MKRSYVITISSIAAVVGAIAFVTQPGVSQETAKPEVPASVSIPELPGVKSDDVANDLSFRLNLLSGPSAGVPVQGGAPPSADVAVPLGISGAGLAPQVPSAFSGPPPTAPSPSLRMIPLTRANSDAVMEIVRALLPQATVAFDARTNTLIVRATEETHLEIAKLVDTLDAANPNRPPAGGGGSPVGVSFTDSAKTSGDVVMTREPNVASTADLKKRYEAAEMATRELAQVVLRDGATGRHQELRHRVSEAFAARQQLLRAELLDVQRRLTTIQQSIDLRERVAQQIIDHRTKELLRPDLAWETTVRPTENPNNPAGQPGGMGPMRGRSGSMSMPMMPGNAPVEPKSAPMPPRGVSGDDIALPPAAKPVVPTGPAGGGGLPRPM